MHVFLVFLNLLIFLIIMNTKFRIIFDTIYFDVLKI